MTTAELNLLAGGYGITIQRDPAVGVYMVDMKSNRYRKLCEYSQRKYITKEKLIQEIRSFTAWMHNRNNF